MTLQATALPYGMRDVRLYPLADDGTPGSGVDLVNSQTFSFAEAETFQTLRGDDGIVAIRGQGATITWALDAGGLTFAAWAVMSGGTNTVTGVTPNQIRRYRKVKTDTKPYFKAEGQAISDSGGDVHAIVYKARASSALDGSFQDGQFMLTKAGGEAIPDNSGFLYDFIQNETATAIP